MMSGHKIICNGCCILQKNRLMKRSKRSQQHGNPTQDLSIFIYCLMRWRSKDVSLDNKEEVKPMTNEHEYEDLEIEMTMKLHRRELSEEQWQTFEGYMADIFTAFGMDLRTPSTFETPRRFLRAMFDA